MFRQRVGPGAVRRKRQKPTFAVNASGPDTFNGEKGESGRSRKGRFRKTRKKRAHSADAAAEPAKTEGSGSPMKTQILLIIHIGLFLFLTNKILGIRAIVPGILF